MGSLETKHNIRFRNAAIEECLSEIDLGAIVLQPDLAVFNVEMDYTAVSTAMMRPTHIDNLVVIALKIEDALGFNLLIGAAIAIFSEQILNDVPIRG